MDRRDFLGILAYGTAAGMTGCSNDIIKTRENLLPVPDLLDVESDEPYKRANTDWLAACKYGIGFHWTAQTVPRRGRPLRFQDAVEAFDVCSFVDSVAATGADYVILTSAHALQMIPAPHPVLDEILPGRSCQRDLIGEIAKRLHDKGIHLILYYNHSCNGQADPGWEEAVGYNAVDKNRLADNLCRIVAYMAQRYGKLLKAWWFDSPYSLDPSGPHNTVTTDMGDFRFPWEHFTKTAKLGYASRLVTYNAGVNQTYLYTTHQDYWAGEMTDFGHPPGSRYLDNGLQWHGWTCLDDRRWVHSRVNTEIPKVIYTDKEVISFVQTCRRYEAPMAFNVGIYQDGTISESAMGQLTRLGDAL